MGLLITQGKQDLSQDNKFDVIIADDVLMQLVSLKLADASRSPETLEVQFRILSGVYKGRIVFDRVNYGATSQFSWKYRQLRKAAGVPYDEAEPLTVDIADLLLNKVVVADLGARAGKDSEGKPKDYQSIKYSPYSAVVAMMPSEPSDDEPDDPFADPDDFEAPDLTDDQQWATQE